MPVVILPTTQIMNEGYFHGFSNTNFIVVPSNIHGKSEVKGVTILDESNSFMYGEVIINPSTDLVQCTFKIPLSGTLIIY